MKGKLKAIGYWIAWLTALIFGISGFIWWLGSVRGETVETFFQGVGLTAMVLGSFAGLIGSALSFVWGASRTGDWWNG